MLSHSITGFSNMLENEYIDPFCNLEFISCLKRVATTNIENVKLLDSLINIVSHISYSDGSITHIVDAGFLDLFFKILECKEAEKAPMSLKKDILWVMGNIAADSTLMFEKMYSTQERYKTIVEYCFSVHYELREDATWSLCNSMMCLCQSNTQESKANLMGMLKNGFLTVLKRNMEMESSVDFLNAQLTTLECVGEQIAKLDPSESGGEIVDFGLEMERCGLCDNLEGLLVHQNHELYEKVYAFIKNYFETEAYD